MHSNKRLVMTREPAVRLVRYCSAAWMNRCDIDLFARQSAPLRIGPRHVPCQAKFAAAGSVAATIPKKRQRVEHGA